MNRDRGLKKWTSMMLPEHMKLLRDWKNEDIREQRPEVDEWLLQEYAEHIGRAWESHGLLRLRCWCDGRRYTYEGVILDVNTFKRSLILEETNGYKQYIDVGDIYEVSDVE